MGRPRKQPARILTANIPLTTWELLDELQLSNRSVWLDRLILDEIEREVSNRDLFAERQQAIQNQITEIDDPARRLAEVKDKRLLVAAYSRIPEDKKRLKNDLARLIKEL